jgi:hypothetical protein
VIDPGFGATTRVLARNSEALAVVEINSDLANRLPATVRVVTGDGTAARPPCRGDVSGIAAGVRNRPIRRPKIDFTSRQSIDNIDSRRWLRVGAAGASIC